MNATANNVITFITDKEADIFQSLQESGALDIQYGKITLNFSGGFLQNIVKEEMKWRRT